MNIKETFSITVTKENNDTDIVLTGTVPKDYIQKAKATTLERLGRDKEIQGFRKGTAPADLLEKEFPSLTVWQESARDVLMQQLPLLLAQEQLIPMGSPTLSFTSIPDGGDVGFTVSFSVLPKVELPDYKALLEGLGKDANKTTEATDKEIEDAILDIRRHLYKRAHPEKEIPQDTKELPELTDSVIQEISAETKDVASFKEMLQKSIAREKRIQMKAQNRDAILQKIVDKVDLSIPAVVIDEETNRAKESMEQQAKAVGTTIEAYCKDKGMTEEALTAQMRKDAEYRAKVQLVLNAIAVKENLQPEQEAIEAEVERLKEKMKGMSEDQIRMYIASVLMNEKVLSFLEKTAGFECPCDTCSGHNHHHS